MYSLASFGKLAGLLALSHVVSAGFDVGSMQNMAVYWGQNSYGQGVGNLAQQRLAYYCASVDIDIIPVAFMNGITPPITNFANAGDNCTAFPNSPLVLNCPQIEEDIKTCQTRYGKTILISLAGATYTQAGWSTVAAAQSAAQLVFDMFGPVNANSNALRPFRTAVVDGFDFDFETTTSNVSAFGLRLRQLMDSARAGGSKYFYLAAAPQCPYPDVANNPALQSTFFDFLMIQYYNNYCGVSSFQQGATTQNNFNFDVWDNWAHTVSKNPNVKILLGIPANSGAGGGYVRGAQLNAAIQWSKRYSSFGGVMMWDASQLYANSGFLSEVVAALNSQPTTTVRPPPTSTTTTSVPPPTSTGGNGGLVPQWGQCGGEGYTGPTQCQPPYKCVSGGQWWSSCQ